MGQLQRDNFARAAAAGVKIAFGTDAGVYPHGDNANQFFYMVKYGLSPARAIRSATSDAADLIGRVKDVGRIAPGHLADLIAVAADPLEDIRALQAVGFVLQGGTVIKDELSLRCALTAPRQGGRWAAVMRSTTRAAIAVCATAMQMLASGNTPPDEIPRNYVG